MSAKKKGLMLLIMISSIFLVLYVGVWKRSDRITILNIMVGEDHSLDISLSEKEVSFGKEIVLGDEADDIVEIYLQNNWVENGVGQGNDKYFFLPDHIDLSDVYAKVVFEGDVVENIYVDDVLLQENEICELGALDEGQHCIAVDGTSLMFQIMKGASLPSVWIETDESMVYIHEDPNNVTTGKIRLFSADGQSEYEGEIESLKGRGNSSWRMLKKSYSLKLKDTVSLAGMTPGKSWVLYGNGVDHTGIRNKLFMDMAEECGLDNAIDSEWLDLYINGEYYGCYELAEKITIASGRLEIGDLEENTLLLNEEAPEVFGGFRDEGELLIKGYVIPENPADITGGYLMEVEMYASRYSGETTGFTTKNGIPVVVKNPTYASREQVQYIASFVQGFEEALYSEDGYNASGKYYLDYIDLESFVIRYLLDEFSKNLDAGFSSYFFYKPQGEDKLYAGPVWDYDTALGNNYGWGDSTVLQDPEGMYVNRHNWSAQLWNKEEFVQMAEEIFEERFLPHLDHLIEVGLDEYISTIYESVEMEQVYLGRKGLDEKISLLRNFIEKRSLYLEEMLISD